MTEYIDLGYRPRAWQRECHLRRKRFSVFVLHRRAGKTELGIIELINSALKFKGELGLFAYISPEFKQSKTNVWNRLKSRVDPLIRADVAVVHEQDTAILFAHNGVTVRVFGGADPDALRGWRLDGIVVDEVAQAKPGLWEEVIRPALADRGGWAIFIGTPKGVNLFSDLYERAGRPENAAEWCRLLFTHQDTEALPAEEIESMRKDMSDDVWAREMLCDFSQLGDDQVISVMDVEEAAHRLHKPGTMDYAPIILGVDPARFGDDRSVIIRRQGLQVFDPIVFNGIDNMALASRVAAEISKHNPEAVFIDSGAGAGVIDRLRQLGHDVTEVNFGGRPMDPVYANKSAEMLFTARDWLRSGGAIPNDTMLKGDLAVRVYSYDAANRIALEPKEKVKARGLRSPDLADALALTFAFPVAKKQLIPVSRGSPLAYNPMDQFASDHRQQSREYDPLSRI